LKHCNDLYPHLWEGHEFASLDMPDSGRIASGCNVIPI
jgi:hypothetical protein